MKKLIITSFVFCLLVSIGFPQNVEKINWMLELQKKINLSKDQIEQLKSLKLDLKKLFINQQAKIKIGELELKELYSDLEKNLNKIKSKLDELALMRSSMKFAQIETEINAKNVLSDEQEKQFNQFLEEWYHKNEMKKRAKKEEMELIEQKWEQQLKEKEFELLKLKAALNELKYSKNEEAIKKKALEVEKKEQELQMFRKEIEAYKKRQQNKIK